MLVHKSIIRGHRNIFLNVWSPTLGEIVSVDQKTQQPSRSTLSTKRRFDHWYSPFFDIFNDLRRRNGSHRVTSRLFAIN